MKLSKALFASVVGTTVMTLFMYVVSRRKKEPMHVPQILGSIITGETKESGELSNSDRAYIIGYSAHYAVGKIFAIGYWLAWKNHLCRPQLPDGIVAGALSGLVGVSVWRIVIAVYPRPVRIPVQSYLAALLGAHFLFGATTFVVYQSLDTHSDNSTE